MLQLQSPVLTVSSNNKPFHDGMNEETAAFELVCPACGTPTVRKALSAISAGERWYRSLHQEEQHEVASSFGLRFSIEGPGSLPYARMQNGRCAYFSLLACPNCSSEAVVALDFHELQPGRYIGTVQGVAAVSPPPRRPGEA
jgi:hypothetical protein